MFGTHFYNQGLRKLTIAFGQIFNNIVLQQFSVQYSSSNSST